MLRLFSAITVVLSGWCSLSGQTEIGDSIPDSAHTSVADTLITDTTSRPLAETIDDSIRIAFPKINPDTLSETQRMLAEFETRFALRQRQTPKPKAEDRFSYIDSLTAYYLSPRWNLRTDIDRSFYHDAGDYFRSDPSFFVLAPQVTPMRKTVQPFGLSGDRLGLILDGLSVKPFEHVVEPDGLVDMYDLPTALNHTVAVIPGPAGMIFGADHSVASLLTLPQKPDSTNPRSCFLVDKGAYSFSYARGRYSKNFTDGRHIDMSVGYRKSDGIYTRRIDNAYHYTGDFVIPLNQKWAVEAEGQLYARDGAYQVLSGSSGITLERNRFDRVANMTVSRQNEKRDARFVFGYQHLRQGSSLDRTYVSNLNQTGHGLTIHREWLSGSTVFKAGFEGDYLEYDSWYENHTRLSGTAFLNLARLARPWGLAASARVGHVEAFGFLPEVAALLRKEAEKSFFSLSVGYSERAPHLNELYLPFQNAKLYGGGSFDYADGGNSHLISEKMLQGAAEISLGRLDKSVTIASSGGKIWDGIDWLPVMSGSKRVFTPTNGDINWASITTTGRMRFSDFLNFKGGGCYHYIDYAAADNRAYTPEYQAFSGMELHLFWRQKLIDFWAYGEMVYVGPYDGYRQTNLGNSPVVNAKLSFRMGNFHFYWISQNSLS
ncbi:MAG: hypothetical protein NTW07_02930, partial [candidate division Zixibacteria bacterium]|nr:hypothetical protein [candidate division Zixibacteria bacterium]